MNREDSHYHHPLPNHLPPSHARPSLHLVPLHSNIHSTSRRFKSVNISLNPVLSTHKSELDAEEWRKRHSETIEHGREHEIYFNRTKKYNYMKEIIDKYFEESKKDKHIVKRINPESSTHKPFNTLVPKINHPKEEKQ